MSVFAKELVGLQVDVIFANTTPVTAALQRETRTIPIVVAGLGDPVASGIVARLDRPGANITGFANLEASMGGKWLELLSEITPGLKRAAIMFNSDTALVSAVGSHLRRQPSRSRSRQSLRPFVATWRSKRPSTPSGASREAALSACRIYS